MWLGIAIIIGWAVGGLIALNRLPKNITKLWDGPGEKELRIIQAIALLLIIAGVTVFFVTEPGTFWHDLWPEMISTGGVVLGIDELNRRRIAQEYKRGIIRQMASFSNDFALEAARIARDKGWIEDGSLVRANLVGANLTRAPLMRANFIGADLRNANFTEAKLGSANLKGANLGNANLRGVDLFGANLEDANLVRANLEMVDLGHANLKGVNLIRAILQGANLEHANLQGALFDEHTYWPQGLDFKEAGAIDWNELSEQKRGEWRRKYHSGQQYGQGTASSA